MSSGRLLMPQCNGFLRIGLNIKIFFFLDIFTCQKRGGKLKSCKFAEGTMYA